MSEPGSLEALSLLQSDLLALSQSRLHSVDRLWAQLEQHIVEFRKLLDKAPRSNASRQKLSTGKVEIRDQEYQVNQEFQQGALQVADALELDEIAAAEVFLDAQDDAISMGRSQFECSILRFHKRQNALLECFRTVLEMSIGIGLGTTVDEDCRGTLQRCINLVLNAPQGSSEFIRKCLSSMANGKKWLQSLTEKVDSASILGQSKSPEFSEIIEVQRLHLVKQHELLGLIIYYLVKSNQSSLMDLDHLLDVVKKIDKYDNLLVHYLPAVGASIQACVHSEGSPHSLDQLRPLYEKYFGQKDDQSWPLHYVYAALSTWWLSEYIAWYDENSADPLLAHVDVADVRAKLSDRLVVVIKEGAFDLLMSMCVEVKPFSWKDPAQHEISEWIDHKGGSLSLPWQRIEYTTRSATSDKSVISNPIKFSKDFEMALMDQMELFVDAFICNVPNVLRKLRHDEDEQRQLGQTHDYDMDLEKFLVIISFAFEDRHSAALQAFWSDPNSHMYGFLIWTSHRASTPLACAFNGMFRSIAGDAECADAAHKFLIDDPASSSGQMGKSQCLSWNFIVGELRYFNGVLNERPALSHTYYRAGKPHGDQDETDALAAESMLMLLMLQSYLHIITRVCTQSSEARRYLLESTNFDVVEQLFKLVSIPTPRVPSHLRGCIFNAIEALSISRTKEISDVMWGAVEFWRSGGYFTQSSLPKVSAVGSTYNATMDDVLRELETGFEQANAFVRVLNVLVLPDEADQLKDLVPFPEGLGSSSRMPGISDYVDFVMRVFKNKTYDKVAIKKTQEELNEMRVLRLSCLNFITTCLRSFNEDLLLFAEQSHIPVDNAIRTSNLENYVRLHPFARVMEWLFNDSVMEALFVAIDQDVVEVGSAVANDESDSPLVLSLFAGIVAITDILDMQQTYLSRVRPAMKVLLTHHRTAVSNAAYSSFEDGILKHLSIISKLGQYCTANDYDLTLASLKLLEKLSTSPKLVSPANLGSERRLDRHKAVVALGLYEETEDISKTLIEYMRVDDEADQDPSSPSYTIKAAILSFLNTCVESLVDRPTVAHLLLGFQCGVDALQSDYENSPLEQGTSLFHQILRVSVELPPGISANDLSSALITIKSGCLRLLGSLWTSPLSSVFVTRELRANNNTLIYLVFKEPAVQVDTLWDGRSITDPEFMYSSSASALKEFLLHRASLFKLLAIDLRLLAAEPAPAYKQKLIGTLLGTTLLPDGQYYSNSDVFDLFDFMELEIEDLPDRPELNYLKDIDLGLCHESRGAAESFNINKITELVMLRCRDLQNSGHNISPEVEAQISIEHELLLLYIKKMNHVEALRSARSIALKAWVQLMCMVIENGELGNNKIGFVLKSLQLVLPKLEKYSSENAPDAIDLARLGKALLFSLEFASQTLEMERNLAAEAADLDNLRGQDNPQPRALETGPLTEVTNERLFSLFRISIRAIHTPLASAAFKQIFYSICYRYLTGLARSTAISAIAQRRQAIKTIKLAGDRLAEIICDDAYAGEQECRISALLMLSALVTLARHGGEQNQEDSKDVIESLARLNFIGILVDSIQNMPNELRDTSEQDTTSQIVYCKAKLSLLLQIAQTRYGAMHILNARLFRSVKNSGLFLVDPDLGMDLLVPNAEKVYYEILLAVLRVINACVVSRGAQNEQTLAEGRKFVLESRSSMMTVMKKHAGIGAVDKSLELDIGDLAEAYMLLMSVTDFLKSEEKVTKSKRPKVFT